ncbi:ribokinase [Lapidilactobacillus bayanensis]|uniref:ribokinase n=1 Tax=Lapidilactobacillus bayanensis TaxID=2485998 RepID=UPI000F7A47AA|nr:ribokinase [Lapidilactobacillus bayanensis]
MANKVTIVGSINVDRILQIDALPQPGETICMQDLTIAAGGKGANQAVAAARSGATTSFIGAVGQDLDGQMMLHKLGDNQVNTCAIQVMNSRATGQAYILLQATGQNSIIISAGANADVSSTQVNANQDLITQADYVVAQFETPITATTTAFQIARANQTLTILNPAPATETISKDLLQLTDIIVPNETEAANLTGIEFTNEQSMQMIATEFFKAGVKVVIITLGSRGCFVAREGFAKIIPALSVEAVDTTAAGDTFIGSLATELAPDFVNLESAINYASRASALTVQKLGAFPSIPTRNEVEALG